jgi:hypothetical protein
MGKNIAFVVCANVLSYKFKKWQTQSPIDIFKKMPSEYIAGGNIGNLQKTTHYLKWNLANFQIRDAVIEDIILNINTLAIPFFDSFKQIDLLIASIESSGEYFGISDIYHLSKFLSYVASKKLLERTFSNFLTLRESWNNYSEALNIQKQNTTQRDVTYWGSFARLTLEIELDLNLANKK